MFGQNSIEATMVKEKPKIDGYLTDSIWQTAGEYSNFLQLEPYNGYPASESTKIQFAYGSSAIFVSAVCEIKNGTKIFDILTVRDDFGQADYFGIYLDPYQTGITGYGFFVTAAGVQIDQKVDGNSTNPDWDAVWYSAVVKTDSAYYVEMRIPYSAFRFPKKKTQKWNINFYRNIQQHREISTWNFVDISKTGILNQMGTITNLHNINPPIRLSLMPHTSAYLQKYNNADKNGKTYSGGLDIKYGLNESFTIDMMLIPDYSQIQADEYKLNLSPYETYYDEKRYFFTEGTEIFNKGNIFYSRRIGKVPTKYNDVPKELSDNNVIIKNPQQTRILNATKISGKTNKGLGIGFINAFTGNTYAEIHDTLNNNTKTILTEPISNYNIFAINKPIKNNSYISLTNTNFSSFGRKYYANVVAQEISLKNKNNSWSFFERFALSSIINDTIKPESGISYNLSVAKISGNLRISASQSLFDDKYNPNDLGYLKQNNTVKHSLSVTYNIFKPFGYFLSWRNSFNISQSNLYKNLKYIETNINFTSRTKLKNNMILGAIFSFNPKEVYDYFEPRVENKFYVKEPSKSIRFWLSSNYANPLAYDFNLNYHFAKLDNKFQRGYELTFSPRIRFSNRALLVLSSAIRKEFNNIGYVDVNESKDSVFFGKRNIKYTTNSILFDYIFTKNISINLNVKHYWSLINYLDYFYLGKIGKLYPLEYSYHYLENKDVNYNSFTIDFIFKWLFLPGSEFSVVYKKLITSSSTTLIKDYYDNFENMYFNFPILNSISFKIIFYLDYNTFFHRQQSS